MYGVKTVSTGGVLKTPSKVSGHSCVRRGLTSSPVLEFLCCQQALAFPAIANTPSPRSLVIFAQRGHRRPCEVSLFGFEGTELYQVPVKFCSINNGVKPGSLHCSQVA